VKTTGWVDPGEELLDQVASAAGFRGNSRRWRDARARTSASQTFVAELGTLNERVDGGGSRARLALASTGTVVSSALMRKM
jgi:hypothetical protein